METKYFIVVNGQQEGPFSFAELASKNLTPDTLVWYADLSGWTPASQIPELSGYIYPSRNDYGQQVPPSQSYNPNTNYGPQPGYTQQPGYSQKPGYTQQPGFGQQSHTQPNNYQQPYGQLRQSKWLTWAIVSTIIGFLFSCLGGIFGIIGIVKANAANKAYSMGDVYGGEQNDSSAKLFTIIALCLGGVGLVAGIIQLVLFGSTLSALMAAGY